MTPLLEVKLGSAENPEVDREKLSRRLCTALRKQPPTITTQVKRKSKPTEQAPPIISIDLVCVDDVPPPMVPGKLSETDQARADVQKLWTWHLDVGFPVIPTVQTFPVQTSPLERQSNALRTLARLC